MEAFFSTFRNNIIGSGQVFDSPYGPKSILYADWTASGRAYRPIEEYLQKSILPFVANTHTETTITGARMSAAYEEAKEIVKAHVHAGSDDVLIFCGSGMTGAVNKLQRILGLRLPERIRDYIAAPTLPGGHFPFEASASDETLRPVVFITQMEHHSNQLSWLETIATVEIIRCGEDGNVDLEYFEDLLEQYKRRKYKFAAVTACSNVTGIRTPYHEIAKMIHEYDGLCFVDFACSAPYADIDMHPPEKGTHLDAIYFSPHKFLGGPGTPGVLVFHKKMYRNKVPDQPGGGTVLYTNPWGEHEYVKEIEQREDGGTPPFLQGIKTAMCIRLKEAMGVTNMLKREEELLKLLFVRFEKIKNIEILEGNNKNRLGIISFIVTGAHYSLIVKLLNDRFGIQTRGGCSCAGTYGHRLLRVDKTRSHEILDSLHSGNLREKPGWIRLSIHPTMTDAEIGFIMDAIEWTASHFQQAINDYRYDTGSNEYVFRGLATYATRQTYIKDWFTVSNW